MTNEAPDSSGDPHPADPTREAPAGLLTQFFRGLRFSIFTLWGMVFGAGLSVPIVLDYWRFAFGVDLTLAGVVGLGCYLLMVGFLGTWLSLGLLGEWAGRTGGRPLRLIVQVCGILLTACLTLFCAAPLTLLVMAWVGRQKEREEDGTDPRRRGC